MDEDVLKFMITAVNVLPPKDLKPEWGKVKEFKCPVYGEYAKAMRSKENGHFRAMCENCGMQIIE